jgi:hypothetical protein
VDNIILRKLCNSTYIDNIVVKDEPESARLDDRNVMTPIRAGSAMDDDGDEIVHPVRVYGVIGLKRNSQKFRSSYAS